ncbi:MULTISPECIES: Wzz/FepE/Etk N-terminal domain-containing protein [Staphylococcaceae]|uniref:Wzz/FepE/Etk N-terminal domain-containing protein n=1 Tax=Mammaliicoccus sciuri TaxID=1296 RepID=A0AAW5LLP8_MAMSC|nr:MULTISPECIES: Wzz/FepE/Etk N-terminal domain-containing protein [Staphylococcaceae]KOR11795.1 capsule biosynthesis protein CapA [Staphylococcus carnosus]MBF2782371.1 capsule biosynthesis protein CapA [Staphylococcus saprophyticus]MBU8680707.1 capsule biosynthesis protein CapA [Staphylococcus saprophyticus]MCQ9303590.1 Wzz/FepE/Etk N-terminal domain-containing protein [Mammaliicoccus sciuri]MDW4107896.1 Wzz/FepE/Etk N-terminal domain-containing protein [Staphylococcus saprophyticus]
MEEIMDFNKLFAIIKKNYKLIIIIPIILLAISMVITIFINPKFEAKTQILVNQETQDKDLQAQQIQSNLQLVNTYSEIIKSPRILDKVSKKLDNKYSKDEIANMLTVSNQTDSQILTISIKSNNSRYSGIIANEIAKVFSKESDKIMNVDNVSILSEAKDKSPKVSPSYPLNATIALIIGLIFAFIYIFSKEVLDKRIKNEEDVKNYLELPVLGSIQNFNK